jgi:hypothetical protein
MNVINKFRKFRNPSGFFELRMKKFKRRVMWTFLTCLGLKFYTHTYKSDLLFQFQPTEENIETIKNCKELRRV